jgi:hypothetical protein
MMNKSFAHLIITFMFLGIVSAPAAQEADSNNLDAYLESFPAQNPFKPLLPKKIVEPPRVVEPPKFAEPKSAPRQVKPQSPFGTPDEPANKMALPTLVITGIIWNSDRPQAIINGAVVNEGDTVAEIKIVAIRKTGIDIIYQGQAMTLTP